MATTPATAPSGFGRPIDVLAKAANFTPIRQEVTLADGTEFSFYAAPMTAAEREKAQKDAKTDLTSDFAMQLLIQKALDENGEPLFKAGDIPRLKRDVEDEDVQKLTFCVLKPRGESGDKQPDMKSAND
jgi:hypothetical protein